MAALPDDAAPGLGVHVVPVPGLEGWTIRVTVPHADGPVTGWAPFVFWTQGAAEVWLADRLQRRVQPAVRECELGPNDLAYSVLRTDDDEELVLSEPLPVVQAAGVAALFAAEFRTRRRV